MKNFKVTHDTILYKEGKPYVYNVSSKNTKVDLFIYAKKHKIEIEDALKVIEEYKAHISPISMAIYFNDYEKAKEFALKMNE